ncbi:MAG TPA: hypothetical protein PLR82_05135 [Bacillota bacterium]|jgi:hypothetical protein|nr:hypothetical protein [Bacillota bacterium]HQD86366.1 hypothetical protein [Bacillota bacterium]
MPEVLAPLVVSADGGTPAYGCHGLTVSRFRRWPTIRSRRDRLRQERRKCFDSRYFGFLLAYLCLVVLVQGLLRFDSMRALLNKTIWLEGQPLAKALSGVEVPIYTWLQWPPAEHVYTKDTGVICLKFIGEPNPHVWIVVNGHAAKRADPADAVVVCCHGDVIEIVAEKGTANVVVSAVSSNVLTPSVGTWVKGEGVLSLGRVNLVQP